MKWRVSKTVVLMLTKVKRMKRKMLDHKHAGGTISFTIHANCQASSAGRHLWNTTYTSWARSYFHGQRQHNTRLWVPIVAFWGYLMMDNGCCVDIF